MDKKPGYETTEHLWSPNPKFVRKFVDKFVIPFLMEGGVESGDFCYDIGEYNPRIMHVADIMGLNINTINKDDFNWDMIEERDCKRIFAFEILEHLQNPLFFMNELKKALTKDGSIYLIIPCNPRWLWHKMHFFEMDKVHLEKWILEPLDLKIVRYKKIYFIASWKTYLIGFRPIIRVLTGKVSFRDFMRSLFYIQYAIYEVRREK